MEVLPPTKTWSLKILAQEVSMRTFLVLISLTLFFVVGCDSSTSETGLAIGRVSYINYGNNREVDIIRSAPGVDIDDVTEVVLKDGEHLYYFFHQGRIPLEIGNVVQISYSCKSLIFSRNGRPWNLILKYLVLPGYD